MSDEEIIEPVEEPKLFTLPEFEGTIPVGVLTHISGTGQRINHALRIGDRVIIVAECEVVGVNHKEDKTGLKRIQSLGVKDLYEAEGKTGAKLLSKLRNIAKKAEDDRLGRLSLPIDETHTDHGLTLDENGTALTEAEAAAARGEDLLEGPDPVVIIFTDKSRAKWPDDFDDSVEGLYAGDFIANPNNDSDEELQVIEVLDSVSGETIETWTEEDESARLLRLEKELEAEEANEQEDN